MIDITIKTLDSQNHSFSVSDEFTVKQLKEHIAEPVNVPAESQRLIYCGRVLLDDKKLSEYDVNGKVIHLVQRAPPSSGNGNSGQNGGGLSHGGGGMRRPWRAVLNPGVGGGAARVMDQAAGTPGAGSGNAMYLGAMAFPADLMDAQGITMPLPRHGLSQSRLSVARTMLRRARYTLHSLENPTHQESPAELNTNNGDEGAVPPPALAANYFPQMHPTPPGAAPAAEGGGSSAEQPLSHEEVVHTTTEAASAEAPQPTSAQQDNPPQSGRNGNNGSSGGGRYPTTEALAELVSQMRDVNRRLQPFMDVYYELMRDDPQLENPAEAQRLFSRVSEMMHLMAHAYHALSDVMCNLSQPPPRFLRCRPVLIQHSAVLQTGIPIQAQINLSASSSMSSSNQSAASNGGTESGEASVGGGGSSGSEERPSGEGAESGEGGAAGGATPSSEDTSASAQAQPSVQTSGPGNFEFYMDMSPGSVTFGSVQSSAASSRSEPTAAAIAGPFPWGTAPPPEFIQTIMQALAGQMLGGTLGASGGISMATGDGGARGGAAADNGGGARSGGGAGADNGSGARSGGATDNGGGASGGGTASSTTNSQARGNTATHPTTSTQTRSTSRPHVHFTPGIQGMGGQTFFDPFLPCNSHHICGSTAGRRRANLGTAAATPASSGGASAQETPPPQQEAAPPPPPPPPPPPAQSTSSSSDSFPAATNNSTGEPVRDISQLFNRIVGAIETQVGGDGRQSSGSAGGSGGSVGGSGASPTFTFQLRGVRPFLPTGQTFSSRRPPSPVTAFVRAPGGRSLFTDVFETIERELVDKGQMEAVQDGLRRLVMPLIRTRMNNEIDMANTMKSINAQMRLLFESFVDVPMREDVDVVASLSQLNRISLPSLVMVILSSGYEWFRRHAFVQLAIYARSVVAILRHCCLNGASGCDAIFATLTRHLMAEVPQTMQEWVEREVVGRLRRMMDSTVDDMPISQHIVYRMAPPATNQQQPASPPPQPMETEERPPAVVVADQQDESPLPDVIIGAEPWHNTLPPDWVPIITRDRERQRRGAVQGPLSEAYLTGMPTKRRKLVAAAKPHGTLATVISESMASAIGAAGITGGEGIAEAAGCDPGLRAAYRQEVRSSVETTLRSHPDYAPDKYPNAAKYFQSK